MTLQPGLQTTAIHIFPDISQTKGNQTVKSDPLIEYNVPELFLFSKKA